MGIARSMLSSRKAVVQCCAARGEAATLQSQTHPGRMAMDMATATKIWTLAEVHSLPDDGNTYELVHGVLYVTPPPLEEHESIAARLTQMLVPYVESQHLGLVYRPKAVFRIDKDVEVERDLMVR